jgi:hypothetical protein
MFIKFRARNSGIYLGHGSPRTGVYWVDDQCGWQPVNVMAGAVDMSSNTSRGFYFHLGSVRVEISDHIRTIHISWSVRDVNLHALSEVLDFLDFVRRGYAVTLRYFCEGWAEEQCRSEAKAIRAVLKSQKFRKKKVRDSVFVRDMDNLEGKNATSFIKEGLERWHNGRGAVKSEPIAEMMSKFLIYQKREKDGHLMALSSGTDAACHSVFEDGWDKGSAARPYDYAYPSRRYNKLVTESYERILEGGDMWFDHIRAIIPRQGKDPLWVPYQRLLLPLTLPDGSRALGCLCDISPENAIPVLGGG